MGSECEIPYQEVKNTALRLLGRREHSEHEIREKLCLRGASGEQVDEVIEYLKDGNYLSNRRYAEMIIRRRASQGYGLRKISYELAGKGVSRGDIQDSLKSLDFDWCEVAASMLRKKYRNYSEKPTDIQKQQRFLQQRGFEFDEIKAAMSVFRS
ncbi:regulatory protein RecX [Hahella ganghwensis]|uniref:regulatory protein RecX n=1 Tax=Hahella ganghwensis TaxID=286420 RepID=UPI00037DA7DB|nr:regulatory protein RecX [Hahella ganghwensis]